MAITKITSGGITADSIDGTKIADDAINSEHYAATSVDNAHINDVAASKLTGTVADARFPSTLPATSAANLTSIPAGNLTGTVADARISALTASKLTGALPAISGASLTNLDAADLATGTVPTARLGSGTASSSTFLRGDSTYAAAGGGLQSVQVFLASGTWTKP